MFLKKKRINYNFLLTNVLPLPVWPYAKHMAFPPWNMVFTNGWAEYLKKMKKIIIKDNQIKIKI
jgi:hypothetical protein